jgi:ribose transport system ATP-binding protein
MVNDISISQRQLLQIARATVSEGYEVLLLDEPTTSLTTDDTERLFDTVGQLKKENKSIVFISHKLEEVFRLGDVITVFRNGRQVAESPATEVNVDWAVRAMTGHSIDESELFVSGKVSDETILEVKNLWGEKFRDISFSLRKGEILGFSGLVGAGRSELMQAIFGYLPVVSGHIFFEGKPWKFGNPSYAVSHGMLYLPEERRSQGILPDMSVKNNASIGFLRELLVKSLISTSIEVVRVNEIVREYDIKTPTINREIKFLSGGNQQKVIIGRSMSCKPKVLIFDEPTKGIDVGTKTEIYRLMREIAESEGVGVILISSEMKEIIKCSNRVVAMYNGRIVGEYPQNTDNSDILHSILGLGPAKSEGGHDE